MTTRMRLSLAAAILLSLVTAVPAVAGTPSVKPKRADASSERIVMVIEQPTRHHPVAALAFDRAGRLYVGSGDGGPLGDPNGHAQDLGLLLGKILRIDPRDPDGGGPKTYRIPRSNPYVGRPGRDEIRARGLRNPWRISVDATSGDLWIGDAGSDSREEVDRASAPSPRRSPGHGWDFGWNQCEGTAEFADDEGHRVRFRGPRPHA